jgi:hypothetical protein
MEIGDGALEAIALGLGFAGVGDGTDNVSGLQNMLDRPADGLGRDEIH